MNKKIMNYVFGILLMLSSSVTYALDAPVKDTEVKIFSYKTLLSIYDFSYKNILASQRNAAIMFTGPAWGIFQTALLKSKLLDSVKTNKYIVTTVPLEPPQITKQGLQGQHYFWDIKMPAMVLYKNSTIKQVQYLDINMHIIYEDGLKVRKFKAEPGTPINCQKDSEVND